MGLIKKFDDFSKNLLKRIAFYIKFCYNIRMDAKGRFYACKKACIILPLSVYFFLQGVFMRNENKAYRIKEYLQGV